MTVTALALIENGMVRCPRKEWAGMARDACCAEQARHGPGCGFGCLRGAAALAERKVFKRDEKREEKIRAAVRARHAEYYRKWGLLPSQTRAGRARRRPREPRPGGIGFPSSR